MKRFFLLLLALFALQAEAAVTRGATISNKISSVTITDGTFAHTVDANTDLLLLTVHIEAGTTVTDTPNWNTTEDFTLVDQSTPSGSNSDATVYIYGLVSPTATAANIVFTIDSNDNLYATGINYIGTETASVAAATNFLSEDVNNVGAETSTNVHGSAGNAGNALFIAATAKGGDMDPSSNATGFTEVFDDQTGTSSSSDLAIAVSELLDAAPEAITITWQLTDNNASTLVEIVAASSQSVVPLLINQARRRKQ